MTNIDKADPDPQIPDADAGLSGLADPLASLRRALDEDELQIYCQPIQALRAGAGKFPMAEVLVRMRAEEDSMLPPGDFLPVFEHYRMMLELDCWVVGKTVAWMACAPSNSIPSFCINVSSQSLGSSRLVECVADQLSRLGVGPRRLCLEVDEADTLAQPEVTARFAKAVREIGCKVVIDGFGRRSVSFAALAAMKPDFVKIDGAIVRKVLISSVAQLKLKAVVRVGAAAGIGMIAECVEEQEVVARLVELSVDFAQGFGIARPQPIAVGSVAPQ